MMVKVLVQSSRITAVQARAWGEAPRGARLPMLGMALLSAWAGVAGAALQPPAGAAAAAASGFNFAYQSEGARIAAPTQVFDDGHRTYMQFNALDRVPELWTDDGSGRAGAHRITFHLESPYVVVDQVLPRMRLVIDGEDTLIVNQAWKGRAIARGPGGKAPSPRVWTDRTPFGPEEPPGPVAGDRAARPSHDAVRASAEAASNRAAGAAQSRPSLAVSQEDDDQDALRIGDRSVPLDVDEANRRLADHPVLTSEQFADSQLDAMRVQAMEMIARAHQAGDVTLERRLRAVFEELANTPIADGSSRRRPGHGRPPPGPLLALADSRPRSDVPVRDEVEDVEGSPPLARRTGPPGRASAGAAVPAAPSADALDVRAGGAASAAAQTAGSGDAAGRSDNLVFEVRDNQRLSQALGNFLETLGWRLEWESQSDFVVRRGYVVKAPTLRQVLLQTLGEYRLSAVLYSGNLVVAVTGGEH